MKRDGHFLIIGLILFSFFINSISGQKNSTTKAKQRDKGARKNTKESAPPYTFAAWNERGRICLLVKLDAMFTITYDASYGKQVRRF